MAAVFGLFVVVGVEVDIVHDDDISWRQVDAQSTGPCRQQEHEDRIVVIELIDQILAAM